VVVDALSRLDTETSQSSSNYNVIPELLENSKDKSLNLDYPLSTSVIVKHQHNDTTLVQHIKYYPDYFIKNRQS
jgi:hypothetical protein